jgi:hypothetical protein
LNCGFVRDIGTERMSATIVTLPVRSRSTKASIARVEWPIE